MEMTDQPLRVPEVARRLGLDGPLVYDLIANGELAAGKGQDGFVYVTLQAVEDCKRRRTAAAT